MNEYIGDILVIESWRSLWSFMDKYIYPEDAAKSAYVSFAIGYVIYFILHVLSKQINDCLSRNKNASDPTACKVLGNNNYNSSDLIGIPQPEIRFLDNIFLKLVLILAYVSTISIWRAIWMLQLEYFYPQIIENSPKLNQNILNLIYFIIFNWILWYLDMTCTLLSRPITQDIYFTASGNYIVEFNLIRFFQKKVS